MCQAPTALYKTLRLSPGNSCVILLHAVRLHARGRMLAAVWELIASASCAWLIR
jgi:hypothetical protein